MRSETGTVFRLKDYKPTDFIIDTVDMVFRLDPEDTEVVSTLSIRRREGTAVDAPLVLDGDGLNLIAVELGGEPVSACDYNVTPDLLTIRNLPEAEPFNLTITTKINPTANTQLMGLYRTGGNYCTQCEAEGFRRITYFHDRPDVLAVYTVRIEGDGDDCPLLLCNGNRVDTGTLENGRHFAIWHDPFPKPAYLFALVAGNLGSIRDTFTTMSGRDVALEIYVEHGKEDRAHYAMDALKRSMKWDEDTFGREYDLDIFMIVAVSDFNMGAMENKGLNVFNDKYVLADQRTATDQDYANIEAIIAHEYFHNWTGNRITCRDWFQLCLKEGLTVFRDHEFSADMRDRTVKRIAEVRLLRAHQFPEDAGPLAHPVRPREYQEINNFYTATVYEKGSEVVRMLRTILGVDGFRAGLDLYFERHDGDAATIEQFLTCFEDATGTDLSQFSLWYDQPGTPNLEFGTDYDSAAKVFTVTAKQSLKPPVKGSPNAPMHIPVAFGLVGATGSDLPYAGVSGADVTDGVIHLREPAHTIRFEGVAEEPVPSTLRGFSAPVTRVPEPSDRELVFLAQNDSDDYARWEALNTMVMRRLKKSSLDAVDPVIDDDDPVVTAVLSLATDQELGHAYRSLCLTLPGELDVAREIGNDIDPDRIFAALRSMKVAIAKKGERIFARLFHELEAREPFSPDARGAGRRALRMSALTYLCQAGNNTALAAEVFANADNMTERAHALTLMAHLEPRSESTGNALASFATEYRNDHVVMDKWYTIQATVPGHATVESVDSLSRQAGFSWSNPNRVRALIGAFSSGNATAFNRPDGAGYQLLCQAISRLDKHNPQVAARLLTTMRSWKNLEIQRREKARKALDSLASGADLSRDVSDILGRIRS